MVLSKLLLGSSLAALALTGALADEPKHSSNSSARCSAVSFGYSRLENEEARAEAAADAAAYLCSKGKGSATAEAIAEATAKAFAEAVAAASVKCEGSGTTSLYGKASSHAKAEGKVWLSAYAEAVASADVCDECSAFTSFYAHIKEEVFLSAVAEANAEFEGYSNGGRVIGHVLDAKQVIQEATATAYARALAQAKKEDLASCDTEIEIEGSTPNGEFSCKAAAVSFSRIKEIDAVAEAWADAAAYSCSDEGLSHANAQAVAKAVARATAIAVSYVAADCYVKGKGYACGFSSAEAEAVAKATARAFAEGWADAIDCDGCSVQVNAVAEAVGNILVTAVSEAYVDLCIELDGKDNVAYISLDALSVAISDASIQAVAAAVAEAVAGNEYCGAGVGVGAKTCECADNWKKCYHKDSDEVLPCCGKGYVCGKFGSNGICQPKHRVRHNKILEPTC